MKPEDSPAQARPDNPANPVAVSATQERTRVPITLPTLKLAVPEREGYMRQWFLDKAGEIDRALRGGYTFVRPEDVRPTQALLGSDPATDGNTDLGTRVSLHGGRGENGQAERLYLMEIKREWWLEDQRVLADRNERVAHAIRGGQMGVEKEDAGDGGRRYGGQQTDGPPVVKRGTGGDNLFTPNKRRT